MTATIMLIMCWAAMRLAGPSPIGRLLHRALVEAPAVVLGKLKPGHVTLAVVVTMLVVLHLHAGDGDPIRMVGLIAPDIAIWLAGVEFSALVEASVAVVATLAALRRAGAAIVLRRFSARLPQRSNDRHVRARGTPRPTRSSPANDDEVGGGFALAN